MKRIALFLTINLLLISDLFAISPVGLGSDFSKIAISNLRTVISPEITEVGGPLERIFSGPVLQSLKGIAATGYFTQENAKPFYELNKDEIDFKNIWGSAVSSTFGELGLGRSFKAVGRMTHFSVWGFENQLFDSMEDMLLLPLEFIDLSNRGDLRRNIMPIYLYNMRTVVDMNSFIMGNAVERGAIMRETQTGYPESIKYFKVAYFLNRTLLNMINPKKYPHEDGVRILITKLNRMIKEDIALADKYPNGHKKNDPASLIRANKMRGIQRAAFESICMAYRYLPDEYRTEYRERLIEMINFYLIFSQKMGLIDQTAIIEASIDPVVWLESKAISIENDASSIMGLGVLNTEY